MDGYCPDQDVEVIVPKEDKYSAGFSIGETQPEKPPRISGTPTSPDPPGAM
jgi:hypothetical protein